MHIYRSNRMERLVDALVAVVADGSGDPMAKETIVVQSQGMARFVSMRMAEHLSVWANPSFPFPRAILEQAFTSLLDGESASAPGGPSTLDRRTLSLALAARLPSQLPGSAFAPLERYLRADQGGDRLLQLSSRIAQLVDDYCVFRDDWVREWEAGGDPDDWQACLIRILREDFGSYHVGARSQAFFAALAQHTGPLPGFPKRLCVFGISSLPPLYVRLFSALSTRLPVHLFLLSPTQEYWADIRTPREQARLLRRAGERDASSLHLTEGHPLLASFGTLGRELFGVIESEESQHDGDHDAYEPPGEGCLLHALQSDLLFMRRPEPEGDVPEGQVPEAWRLIASDDDSVQVHICHGATREVEVLHDQLSALLQAEDLFPEDIVVMAPDIEVYAPAIEAVFGHGPGQGDGGRPTVPFRIADRGLLASHPALDALLQVVELLQGRFEAPAVLDALSLGPVRERFGIASEELATLRTWIERSGIRWGVDAEHRREVGQPSLAGNTFVFGLERLMLGYAMEGRGHRLFAGRLPFDDMEGGVASLLGRFAAFCECLFSHRKRFLGEHPVSAWRDLFVALLDDVVQVDANGQQELQSLRDALEALVQDAARTGFAQAIALSPMRRLLEERLSESRGAVGFMSGGVTFCQLVPMRSLPFQVVVLLGMDDEAFPRQDHPLGFDKRRAAARPGDRSLRNDDRYLFLEAILSARRKLLISYVGRGIHDNGVRPPSVVLAELLDLLERDYRFARGSARQHLCIEHRLQPFSPAYFGSEPDSRLFSYAAHYFDGARALQTARAGSSRTPFAREPLPAPAQSDAVPLSLLLRYVSHPIRAFLQERLGINLGRDLTPLEARERLMLDPLGRWQAGDELLSLTTGPHAGVTDLPALEAAILASGQLPLGVPGRLTYQQLCPSIDAIARGVQRFVGDHGPRRSEPFLIRSEAMVVEGQFDALGSDALVAHQFSRVGKRRELSLWLEHVLLNYLAEREPARRLPRTSILLGRAEKGDDVALVRFAPIEDPATVMGELLRVCALARRFPIPFAHEASRAYAVRMHEQGDPLAATLAARKAFEADFGDGTDAYVTLAYPDFDALLEAHVVSFAEATMAVYGHLLAHRSEEALP